MSKRYRKRYKRTYQRSSLSAFFERLLNKIEHRFGTGFAIGFGGIIIFVISLFFYKSSPSIGLFFSIISIVFLLTGVLMEIIPIIIKKNKYKKMSKLNFNEVENLNPYDFEEWVASMFTAKGYSAKTTKKSGDFGADVIAKYKDKKIAIQVKQYSGPVGMKAVQEALGGMKYYNCDEAWVVTNSASFTPQAKDMADKTHVNLLNGDETIDFFYKLSNK